MKRTGCARTSREWRRCSASIASTRETCKNTLLTAQKVSEDIKSNANEEARLIVREAEGRSNMLLERTEARLEDIQREIDGLQTQAQGRRDLDRSDDQHAAEHTRLRPRTGRPRARRQHPAPPPAPVGPGRGPGRARNTQDHRLIVPTLLRAFRRARAVRIVAGARRGRIAIDGISAEKARVILVG